MVQILELRNRLDMFWVHIDEGIVKANQNYEKNTLQSSTLSLLVMACAQLWNVSRLDDDYELYNILKVL